MTHRVEELKVEWKDLWKSLMRRPACFDGLEAIKEEVWKRTNIDKPQRRA